MFSHLPTHAVHLASVGRQLPCTPALPLFTVLLRHRAGVPWLTGQVLRLRCGCWTCPGEALWQAFAPWAAHCKGDQDLPTRAVDHTRAGALGQGWSKVRKLSHSTWDCQAHYVCAEFLWWSWIFRSRLAENDGASSKLIYTNTVSGSWEFSWYKIEKQPSRGKTCWASQIKKKRKPNKNKGRVRSLHNTNRTP